MTSQCIIKNDSSIDKISQSDVEVITTSHDVIDSELASLRSMRLSDIDTYGCQIQQKISDKSDEILSRTYMNELGGLKESLSDLQDAADAQRKMLPMFKSPLKTLRRMTGKYDRVIDQINNVTKSLEQHQEKISTYIDYMMEQSDSIGLAVDELKQKEDALQAYADEVGNGNNQIRSNAVANRLRIISGTRVNAEQAQVEALMIVKQQQESKYQLQEVIQNVIPILKMQAVNAIGNRVNKETIEIMKKTREVTGRIIEQNAKDIAEMTESLQNNKVSGVIDEEKLLNAQKILNEAMEKIVDTSESQAMADLSLTNRLREQAKSNQEYLKELRITNKM